MKDDIKLPLHRYPVPNSQVNLDNSNHIADIGKMVGEDRSTRLAESHEKIMAAANWLADICVMELRGSVSQKEIEDAYEALELRVSAELAITQENASEEPAGWQLVPKEPTDSMLASARYARQRDQADRSSTIYRAMLAAAPKFGEEE